MSTNWEAPTSWTSPTNSIRRRPRSDPTSCSNWTSLSIPTSSRMRLHHRQDSLRCRRLPARCYRCRWNMPLSWILRPRVLKERLSARQRPSLVSPSRRGVESKRLTVQVSSWPVGRRVAQGPGAGTFSHPPGGARGGREASPSSMWGSSRGAAKRPPRRSRSTSTLDSVSDPLDSEYSPAPA
jgi:hypothetical protein